MTREDALEQAQDIINRPLARIELVSLIADALVDASREGVGGTESVLVSDDVAAVIGDIAEAMRTEREACARVIDVLIQHESLRPDSSIRQDVSEAYGLVIDLIRARTE